MDIDHPAVELRLPVDGEHYQLAVPRETTHFYWGVLRAGLRSEDAPPTEPQWSVRAYDALDDNRDKIAFDLEVNGEPVHLLDEIYRDGRKRGIGRWIATEPPTLPATVTIRVTTDGARPTVDGDEIALRGTNGARIPWSESIETTFELFPSETPPTEFETRTDGLWDRHTVYVPEPTS